MRPRRRSSAIWKPCFQPDELVGYATQVKPDNHGKLKPINTNLAMKASEFIDRLRDAESIEAVIGPYRADCGAWIRLNPLDGKGQSDRNVAAYRHVLIESDTLPRKNRSGSTANTSFQSRASWIPRARVCTPSCASTRRMSRSTETASTICSAFWSNMVSR